MTTDHETTADEIDRLRNDAGEFDARLLAAETPGPMTHVMAEECRSWRERTANTTIAEIARADDRSRSTVQYHVDGRCSHSHSHSHSHDHGGAE